MGQHTVILTDNQESILSWLIDRQYERATGHLPRSQPVPRKPTADEAIQQIVEGWIDGGRKQHRQSLVDASQELIDRLIDADAETRRRIEDLLAVGDPAEPGPADPADPRPTR